MNASKKAAGAILFISLLTFLSRILGFGREIVLAKYFGLSDMRGAFTVAFKIPNLIRTLLTDTAISAAFLPVFTDLVVQNRKDEAYHVSSSIINISVIILTTIVVVCSLFMPYVVTLCAPGFTDDPILFKETSSLSVIIFPTLILFAVSGVLVGMLNSYSHFTAPSVGPLLWNIIIIIVVMSFWKEIGIESAAWGILIGTFAQFVILIKPLKDLGVKYYFTIDFKNPSVRRVFKLILPVTLSLGIINFNVFVDTMFASFLGPRSVAAIDSAFRIFHMPMGIFAVAIGTVLFPVLSKFSSEKENTKFSNTLETGIGQIFYLTVPCACIFFVLANPVVGLVFERGNFTSDDTVFVAKALIFFSIGLPFSSANTLLNRGFYSLKNNWTPLYVGVINIFLNALLDWILMQKYGHAGICFSTSLVSTFNFLALLLLIKKKTSINIKNILFSFSKIFSLSMFVTLTAYVMFNWLNGMISGKINNALLLLTIIFFSSALYIIITSVLKIRESEIAVELFNKVRRKTSKNGNI
ncbi:MAG: murein biosynthesis integral membrane protein MurJ [Candidatus Schekmanbacteria bacterium]|nr:murein biosynthesis integral membrane protein MurJ [Candidatus Schekmanbacteria bacterium]